MTTYTDQVRSLTQETDGQIFIPGSAFQFNVGTWTLTRGAAGNYFMRKTAADETANPSINLTDILLKKFGTDPNSPDNTHDIRGVELKKIQVLYAIGAAALDAHTYDLHQTTYANEIAPSVLSTIGGTLTGTLLTTTNVQPRVTAITVGTPYVLGNNTDLVADWFELTVDTALTSVYDLYGVFLDFDYNLL